MLDMVEREPNNGVGGAATLLLIFEEKAFRKKTQMQLRAVDQRLSIMYVCFVPLYHLR